MTEEKKAKTVKCPKCGWHFVIGTKICRFCRTNLEDKPKVEQPKDNKPKVEQPKENKPKVEQPNKDDAVQDDKPQGAKV
jgi:uncharacterized OB-fold protein